MTSSVCADKNVCDKRFDAVYDETYTEIRKFIACKCGDPDWIPDILQEVYLEYYRTLLNQGCDYVRDDRSFIYKIASRRVMRYYTLKQRLRKVVAFPSVEQENGEDVQLDFADPSCIEESYISAEEADMIKKALTEYSPEIKKIIYLFYAEEMSLPEIAGAMNMNISTVKSKLYRTVNAIRKKFDEERGK